MTRTMERTAASKTISRLGPPLVRGICFSCDASTGLDTAEAVAAGAQGSATWYSVGVLHDDRALADQYREFCDRTGLSPLFHPVDLDLCGVDPLDPAVLAGIADLASRLSSPWVNADLAMWCRGGEALLECLIAMPLIPEAVSWTADRIKHAQDVLQVPIAIENAPYPFVVGEEDVLQMMTSIAEEADCLMTLDVGHLYSLRTQRHQPGVLPSDSDVAWHRVVEAHMSGTFLRRFDGGVRVVDDKHSWPVDDEVWDMGMELLPRATNLRAVMAEAEGMSVTELVASVVRFNEASRTWWGS